MFVIFIGYGSLGNIFEDNLVMCMWESLVSEFDMFKGIVCVLVYWYIKGIVVIVNENFCIIYDFGGFL